MNQLTNEEKARVFAMYLGQKVFSNSYSKGIRELTANDIGNVLYSDDKGLLNLTPLQDITDEHAVEVAKMIKPNWYIDEHNTKDIAWSLQHEFFDIDYNVYQYLIQKGYAVPLFFGVNHWANGKTAIELGIAIDKTQK
jgi:hypothetical protein